MRAFRRACVVALDGFPAAAYEIVSRSLQTFAYRFPALVSILPIIVRLYFVHKLFMLELQSSDRLLYSKMHSLLPAALSAHVSHADLDAVRWR